MEIFIKIYYNDNTNGEKIKSVKEKIFQTYDKNRKAGYMLLIVLLFFMFMFIVCELLKYRRLETIRISMKSRELKKKLYNEKIVFLKAVILPVIFILMTVYFFTKASGVERSDGARGFVICFFPLLLFAFITYKDIKEILKGHNEKILDAGEKETLPKDAEEV